MSDEFRLHGSVDARVIDAFAPIVRATRGEERLYDGCFFGYPLAEGALLLAIEGRVLAAFHDRSAKLTAPVQIMLPDAVLSACAPPKPVTVFYEGDVVEHDLPEWVQPGRVMLTDGFVIVGAKGKYPGDEEDEPGHVLLSRFAETGAVFSDDDYRAKEPRFDPRAVFDSLGDGGGEMDADPKLLALFSRCVDVFNPGGMTRFSPTGDAKPITVLFSEEPDFFGLIMPMRGGTFAMPAFVLERECVA